MDLKRVAMKFAKGAIFGGGSALFSIDISSLSLQAFEDWKKLGVVALFAVSAGALHGLWEVGKQVFKKPTESL